MTTDGLKCLDVEFCDRKFSIIVRSNLFHKTQPTYINFSRVCYLHAGGARDKVAYAFGLGLERWAMKLYGIPDIRLFWSKDEGFLHQFKVDDINKPITYKAVSNYPPCPLDISFWLPDMASGESHLEFERNFFEIVREVAGDLVEQVYFFSNIQITTTNN